MAAQPFRWVMTASGVPLALSEFEAKPAPGEAVVKIAGCGVCHTDLGYYYDGCAPITRCRFALVTKSAAMSSRRDQTRTRGSAKPCARGDPMRNLRRLQALYDGQGRVAPVQSDGVPARALGNWGCRPELYPAALDLVLQGRVKVGPFVEQHPLADINKVFTAVHHGELQRRAKLVPAA